MELIPIVIGLVLFLCGRLFTALTANREVGRYVDQELRSFSLGAGVHIYKGGYVGVDPAGYAKAFVPGDVCVGIAYEEIDNSGGAAGDKAVRVYVQGDFELTVTGATLKDVGKAVYATDDATSAFSGHPDAFIGRVVNRTATNTVVVRLKSPGEKLTASDTGSYEIVDDFVRGFEDTGTASATKYNPSGLKHQSVLGLGVSQLTGEDGGVSLSFDAVAEIASATISTKDVFPVDKGITFEGRLHLTDIGDDGALDVDFGLGTLLTANSIADIDHVDMEQLACLHMDGNSANVLAQSDDNTTDVAPVDTGVDNVIDAGSYKEFKVIVRPTGPVEFWINGVRQLSTTTFAVLATAALCAFVNIEKTSNDLTAVLKADRLRVAGGRA